MVSFMRLRQRKKVHLPQPDGTDHGHHFISAYLETDISNGLLFAVKNVHAGCRHDRISGLDTAYGNVSLPGRRLFLFCIHSRFTRFLICVCVH